MQKSILNKKYHGVMGVYWKLSGYAHDMFVNSYVSKIRKIFFILQNALLYWKKMDAISYFILYVSLLLYCIWLKRTLRERNIHLCFTRILITCRKTFKRDEERASRVLWYIESHRRRSSSYRRIGRQDRHWINWKSSPLKRRRSGFASFWSGFN